MTEYKDIMNRIHQMQFKREDFNAELEDDKFEWYNSLLSMFTMTFEDQVELKNKYTGKADKLVEILEKAFDNMLFLHEESFGLSENKYNTVYVDNFGICAETYYENNKSVELVKDKDILNGLSIIKNHYLQNELSEFELYKNITSKLFGRDFKHLTGNSEV